MFLLLQVTKDVSLLSRWMTIDLYIGEVDSLKFELSMNSDSLSQMAHEILEQGMAYCNSFHWPFIWVACYHVKITKA
jgi:phosphoenolpyruvate carboxylase